MTPKWGYFNTFPGANFDTLQSGVNIAPIKVLFCTFLYDTIFGVILTLSN